MVPVFAVTIFLSAVLLFAMQPMFTRMALPLLGGSPAVWKTAVMFFQATLLAGYVYAHLTTKSLGVRRQILLHFVILLLPLLALPIAIPSGWLPPTQDNPIPWLLTILAVGVGLPFFVVAATSPLLQRWFAASGHRLAHDPYFLYSASNLGSLLALASYPVLIEPYLGLARQSWWWAAGYVVLAVLVAVCGLWIRKTSNKSGTTAAPADVVVASLTIQRRLRWLLLALVPASQMLSVTTYMTSEIAPVPLLWVLPLGIYLLTFVLVFARRLLIPHSWMTTAVPIAIVAVLWKMIDILMGRGDGPVDWLILLHLVVLFVVAMACHGELAKDRPPAIQLTEFYVWISAGGVIGGMFNALLAPALFPTVLEYPVTLVVACALLPRQRFLLLRRPVWLALVIAVVFAAVVWPVWRGSHRICRARSFFGIHQVVALNGYHYLTHGNTTHGIQSSDPTRRREPLAYYARTGPLGEIIKVAAKASNEHVAVVGLGAGSAACYGEPGQQWTFYEIDPLVEQIARDPRYFTFLEDSTTEVKIVLGDARLSLQKAEDGQFGLIILDAYSSDALPLHLITREALALYLRKLTPDGILAFHITTRHLDLKTVLANLAQDVGLSALYLSDFAGPDIARGKCSSRWLVMARRPEILQTLANAGYWRTPRPVPEVGVWTDDYASLFRVWSWK